MEISLIGSIETPYGELELIPQDRNLLQVSSVEPLQFGDHEIHLWALLERTHETWCISSTIVPVVHLIGQFGRRSMIVHASIPAELMKSVLSQAVKWALARPEVFDRAAATSFEYDKEGVDRELEALGESLTCSAHAVESIISEVSSENSARLRQYSQKLRSLAFEVPVMQKIARAIPYLEKAPSRPLKLLRIAPVVRPTVFRQSQSTDQLTIGPVSKRRPDDRGISQRDLVFKPR